MAMYNTSSTAISAMNNEITFASSKNIYVALSPKTFQNDIASQAKLLAQSGYGLNARTNISILDRSECLHLKNVWVWLSKCKDLHHMSGRGVFSVLHGGSNVAGFNDVQRETAMKMCGWVGLKQMNLDFLKQIAETNIDRAIALAILYGDMKNAIYLLQQQHDQYERRQVEESNGGEVGVEEDEEDVETIINANKSDGNSSHRRRRARIPISVRIALAGYPSIQTSGAGLWYDMAHGIVNELNDFPYIQWAFRVLLDSKFNELVASAINGSGGGGGKSGANNKTSPTTTNRSVANNIDTNFNSSPFDEFGDVEESYEYSSSSGNAILMTDRIALACKFLPKGKLINYLKRLYHYAEANSKIEGLILVGFMNTSSQMKLVNAKQNIANGGSGAGGNTNQKNSNNKSGSINANGKGNNSGSSGVNSNSGNVVNSNNIFSPDGGIRLLQKYIDRTGDVQTAALILAFTGNLELLYNSPGKQCVASYRELLNRWEMYRERARFDCDRADIERYVGNNGNRSNRYVPKWIVKTQLSVSVFIGVYIYT